MSLSFISRQEDTTFSWNSKLSTFPIWNHYIFGNSTMKIVYFHGKWKAGFSFKISRRKLYIFYENKRGKDGQYKNMKCLAFQEKKIKKWLPFRIWKYWKLDFLWKFKEKQSFLKLSGKADLLKIVARENIDFSNTRTRKDVYFMQCSTLLFRCE